MNGARRIDLDGGPRSAAIERSTKRRLQPPRSSRENDAPRRRTNPLSRFFAIGRRNDTSRWWKLGCSVSCRSKNIHRRTTSPGETCRGTSGACVLRTAGSDLAESRNRDRSVPVGSSRLLDQKINTGDCEATRDLRNP